jgi:hypothetical protein
LSGFSTTAGDPVLVRVAATDAEDDDFSTRFNGSAQKLNCFGEALIQSLGQPFQFMDLDLQDMSGLFENARAELVEVIHSELVESFIANPNVLRTLPQIASSKTAICYLSFVIAPKARGQRRRWKCQKVTTTPTSINKITIG